MGRLVGQGAELLHSLWAHAERAVLRGKPPPPPPRISHGARFGFRDVAQSSATHVSSAATDTTAQRLQSSAFNTLKSITGDAFTAVFVSVRQPATVDSALATQFREMMRSARTNAPLNIKHGMAFKQSARPKIHLPAAPGLSSTRHGQAIGLNPYARTFAPYSLFSEQFVTHAPLALRAAVDELEDEWQKHYRKRCNAARRVGMPKSTRRSGYLMDRFKVEKMKPVTDIPKEVQDVIAALRTKNEGSQTGSTSVNAIASESVASSVETSVHEAFSFPCLPEEPMLTTRLLIPLCPDLELLLDPQAQASVTDLESHSQSAFLQDVGQVMDSFNRHRLKRIVTIERAFDQDSLRPYRPKEWDENMLIELFEGTQDVRQICLTIDFPDLSAIEVERLLEQAMSVESARWYASFLYEIRKESSHRSGLDSWTGITSPPSSIALTDLGRDVEEMGAASLVSMADHRNTPSRSRSIATSSPELQYPTLDLSSSSPLWSADEFV